MREQAGRAVCAPEEGALAEGKRSAPVQGRLGRVRIHSLCGVPCLPLLMSFLDVPLRWKRHSISSQSMSFFTKRNPHHVSAPASPSLAH